MVKSFNHEKQRVSGVTESLKLTPLHTFFYFMMAGD